MYSTIDQSLHAAVLLHDSLTQRLFSASGDIGSGVVGFFFLNRLFSPQQFWLTFCARRLLLFFFFSSPEKKMMVCQGPKGRAALDSHDLFTKICTHLTSPNNPQRVQRYVKKISRVLIMPWVLINIQPTVQFIGRLKSSKPPFSFSGTRPCSAQSVSCDALLTC